VRTQIDELMDSREPQTVAGIVSDFRVINGQRGKLGLFKLDDKSGDDRSLGQMKRYSTLTAINSRKMSLWWWRAACRWTHFSGGLRVKVQQVWDLAGARCRFGKYLHIGGGDMQPDVPRLVSEFPPRREETEQGEILHGLRVRMGVRCVQTRAVPWRSCSWAKASRFFPRTPRWRPGARRREAAPPPWSTSERL
jgi:DNA polymerase-3 subunit alpha